jgi:hypothetical protein
MPINLIACPGKAVRLKERQTSKLGFDKRASFMPTSRFLPILMAHLGISLDEGAIVRSNPSIKAILAPHVQMWERIRVFAGSLSKPSYTCPTSSWDLGSMAPQLESGWEPIQVSILAKTMHY